MHLVHDEIPRIEEYLAGALWLFAVLLGERASGKALAVPVVVAVFAAVLLYGAFGRARPSSCVTSG